MNSELVHKNGPVRATRNYKDSFTVMCKPRNTIQLWNHKVRSNEITIVPPSFRWMMDRYIRNDQYYFVRIPSTTKHPSQENRWNINSEPRTKEQVPVYSIHFNVVVQCTFWSEQHLGGIKSKRTQSIVKGSGFCLVGGNGYPAHSRPKHFKGILEGTIIIRSSSFRHHPYNPYATKSYTRKK